MIVPTIEFLVIISHITITISLSYQFRKVHANFVHYYPNFTITKVIIK